MKAGTYKVVITDTTESWYDSNGNMIHYKNSNGLEEWMEHDSNGKLIYYKNSYGLEKCYDSNGNWITKEEYDQIHNSCDGKVIEVNGKKYELKIL